MIEDKIRWNEKYKNDSFPNEPSDLVKKFYTLSRGKKALDIAAGLGRNSIFLAQKGFYVDAIDISDVAVEKLKKLHPNINPIHPRQTSPPALG